VFHSQSSGESIFQKIDALLSKYDVSKVAMARIYFFILSLGFKGKYSEFKDTNIIKNYEQRIYAFIYGINPSLIKYDKLKLFPKCYDNVSSSKSKDSRLPDVKFWLKIIGAITVVYVFASYVLWYDVASGLYESLDGVFEHFTLFLSKK
jgi:type VI protein secretion system component VasF